MFELGSEDNPTRSSQMLTRPWMFPEPGNHARKLLKEVLERILGELRTCWTVFTGLCLLPKTGKYLLKAHFSLSSIQKSHDKPSKATATKKHEHFKSQKCTLRFTAALFTITKRWKQPKCPSMEEWINKMWSIHTMAYYAALKRKEILTPATTWMNLENIIFSEISQTQKDKYYMIPLIQGP